jgi:hypothetical protein
MTCPNPTANLPHGPDGRVTGPGRPKGCKDKIGRQAKENIIEVFEKIGSIKGMVKWAKANRTDFYKLYARLIPVTVQAAVDVRHASEYSDDELARIVAEEHARFIASASSGGIAGKETSEPAPGSVH